MTAPPPTPIDLPGSRALARRVRARPQQCWWNAWAAWRHAPAGTRYVEGYVLGTALPVAVEHGWLEGPDGRVLDPTPVMHAPGDPWTGRRRYFPGVRYTPDEARAAAGTGRGFEPGARRGPWRLPVLPMVFAHGWGGLEHPGMHAAHDAVMVAIYGGAYWAAIQRGERVTLSATGLANAADGAGDTAPPR